MVNDADPKRMRTLRDRYQSCTCPNVIFTCATAQNLEKYLRISSTSNVPSVQFNRIICDVPCSGDGTFRKSPHLWRLFRPRFGAELHPLQLDIAKCCLRLLRVGGRLIYSTCSLNPIEDEAVVSALLLYAWEQGMNLRLADPVTMETSSGSDDRPTSLMQRRLPGMKYRPGVRTWRCDEDVLLAGEKDGPERQESVARLPPVLPSMSPQVPEASPLADCMCLERCMRIVPQDMNTGGFFVAVLELHSGPPPAEYVMSRQEPPEGGASKKRPLTSMCAGASGDDEDEHRRRSLKTFHELGYNPKVATNGADIDVAMTLLPSRQHKMTHT